MPRSKSPRAQRGSVLSVPAPPRRLAEPGEVLVYDHLPRGERRRRGRVSRLNDEVDTKQSVQLRCFQWNIERGYKLPGIVEELKRIDVDVLNLQELDIDCRRTDYQNIVEIIAKELQLFAVFCCEFVEVDHPTRSQENAVGTSHQHQQSPGEGYHGNAILSKFPLEDVQCWPHSCNLEWEREGYRLKEPRFGERLVLRASVNLTHPAVETTVVFYNLHLEVFAGPLMRAQQLGDAVSDATKLHFEGNVGKKLAASGSLLASSFTQYVICGDLNTMAHGLPRLSPKYCTDRIRFLGVGETEAEWLSRNFLFLTSLSHKEATRYLGEDSAVSSLLRKVKSNYVLDRKILSMYRLPSSAHQTEVGLGFHDPFHLRKDITLDNPTYYGLVTGKLDWVLSSTTTATNAKGTRGGVRGVAYGAVVDTKSIGNNDFSLSDHKWLYVTYRYGREEGREGGEHFGYRSGEGVGFPDISPPYRHLAHSWRMSTERFTTRCGVLLGVLGFLGLLFWSVLYVAGHVVLLSQLFIN